MSKKSPDRLDKLIEALLFVYGEPVSVKKLARLVGQNETKIDRALTLLKERLESQSGLRLIEKNQEVQLVSQRDFAPIIEKLFRQEHREDLTRAALEVLALVAYEGPISRAEIETIRGVNSAYTIRGLLLRGLIDKVGDERGRYDLSFEAARRFGLEKKEDLPQWGEMRREIAEAKEALAKLDERNT